MDYESYRDARKDWQSVATDQTKFLDQSNLTLAGGALGLTLTFLHDFVCEPRDAALLYWGGFLLLASVVLTLASVHTSQSAINRYIEKLDDAARADFSPESVKFSQNRYVNFAAQVTFWLNVLSSMALVAGVASVALFAYNNLDSRNSMRCDVEKRIPQPVSTVQKGAVPISPAVARPQPSQSSQTQGGEKK